MAHKKAAGSAKNLRDSKPKYRGLKLFGGQKAVAGNIILRQKGDKYVAGKNTYVATDFTIHAQIDGIVSFRKKNIVKFNGRKYLKTVVDILPEADVAKTAKATKKSPTKTTAAQKDDTNTKSSRATATKKTTAKKSTTKATTKKSSTVKKTTATKKTSAKNATTKTAAKKTTTKKA